MFKDYSFISYMFDEKTGLIPDDVLHGIIGTWCSNAKKYYETKTHEYYLYSFKDNEEKILLKLKKDTTKEKSLEYEDFQTVLMGSKSVEAEISSINQEKHSAILLINKDKGIIPVTMDTFDYNEGDKVNVFLNFFPSRIELRHDEDDYYSHLNGKKGEFNIFDIGVGELFPVVALIRSNPKDYPNVDQNKLKQFDDSFMVGSGVVKQTKTIVSTMKIEEANLPNNELPIGKFDFYEVETKYGKISGLVDDPILENFLNQEKIDSFGPITEKTIIKMYGYMSAIIDIK